MSDEAPAALFDVAPAAAGPRTPGATEQALRAQLAAGYERGTLVDEDRPLAESALVLARALDNADRVGGLKGGYLAAQAQPPFQRACHALRLPVELGPASAAPPAGNGHTDLSGLLGDAFGTPE